MKSRKRKLTALMAIIAALALMFSPTAASASVDQVITGDISFTAISSTGCGPTVPIERCEIDAITGDFTGTNVLIQRVNGVHFFPNEENPVGAIYVDDFALTVHINGVPTTFYGVERGVVILTSETTADFTSVARGVSANGSTWTVVNTGVITVLPDGSDTSVGTGHAIVVVRS